MTEKNYPRRKNRYGLPHIPDIWLINFLHPCTKLFDAVYLRRVAIWTVGCGKNGICDPCIVWITFNTICWPIKSTNKYLCSAFKIFNEIFKNTKIRAKLYPRQSPLSQKKKKQRKLLQLNGTSFFIMFIDSVASFYFNTLSCRQHAIVINCLTA